MSMTIEQMRAEVANLYPGANWAKRVREMSERQILAIYNRQVLNGKRGSGA